MRVLYPGGFDLFHDGHHRALSVAAEVAHGHLTVAVNSDAFMTDYKRVPARDQTRRMADVRDSNLADEVILWEGPERQAEQILAQHPDIYVASFDWIDRDLAHQLRIPSLKWFDDHGISLLYVRRTPGISTTQLIEQATMRASSDSATASSTGS